MGGKTHITIGLLINEVPASQPDLVKEDLPESRHVVLNLDAVIINDNKKSCKEFVPPENFNSLVNIPKVFIAKTGEPWIQVYWIKNSEEQVLFKGVSGEILCFPWNKWTDKKLSLVNFREKTLLTIKFDRISYNEGSHERSFSVCFPENHDDENTNEVVTNSAKSFDSENERELGKVKLQNVAGYSHITCLVNSVEGIHFSCRLKSADCINIVSGESKKTVAIIDIQRTNWRFIDSYMITFTSKDISFYSKALLIAAAISYDIGFQRRRESVNAVSIYFLYFSILFTCAFVLFSILQVF